jgi:hypothetical protein
MSCKESLSFAMCPIDVSSANNLPKPVIPSAINLLQGNKLLCKFQSGFLPGCSTTHQLKELYHRILLALDSKQFTSVTFADISKALSNMHNGFEI